MLDGFLASWISPMFRCPRNRVNSSNGRLVGDVSEETTMMHIPSSVVGARSVAAVLVFDLHRASRGRRPCRMPAVPDLELSLLVRGDHEVVRSERLTIPDARVEVEDAAGFEGEVGIAREDPTAVSPGPDRVLVQPAPDGGTGDLGNEPAVNDVSL